MKTNLSKFTPGPWEVSSGLIITAADGSDIAEVVTRRHGDAPILAASMAAHNERKANAALMAAAPELLEAVQRMLRWMGLGCDIPPSSITLARCAAEKATGNKH